MVTKASKKAKRPASWSHTSGEKGASVRVYERTPDGVLYGAVGAKLPDGTWKEYRESLGHRDRARAIAWADAEAAKQREGRPRADGPMTVDRIMALFLAHGPLPKATSASRHETRRETERRAKMWRALHGKRRVATLGRAEWEAFVVGRLDGSISPQGEKVTDPMLRAAIKKRVGNVAVAKDLKFAIAVFNWGLSYNLENGATLLDRNPWGAPAPGVKRAYALPKNAKPRRPVRTWPEFQKLIAVADRVLMRVPGKGRKPSYLRDLLELCEQTGRRIGEVVRLMYSDIVRAEGQVVALRWRPFKHDAADEVEVMEVRPETRATLERILGDRPGLGDAPLFPSFSDPRAPITVDVAADWYRRAEKLVPDMKHLDGGCWHPLRRKYVTERKDLPDADVAASLGSKSIETMKKSYQHADAVTTRAVVNHPKKLMERRA